VYTYIFQTGEYQYTITSGIDTVVLINVQSRPLSAGEPVIRATSWLSNGTFDLEVDFKITVYAYVEKDGAPVTKATVSATIEGPDIDDMTMSLKDNGVGK
jgi:hypothetical protein